MRNVTTDFRNLSWPYDTIPNSSRPSHGAIIITSDASTQFQKSASQRHILTVTSDVAEMPLMYLILWRYGLLNRDFPWRVWHFPSKSIVQLVPILCSKDAHTSTTNLMLCPTDGVPGHAVNCTSISGSQWELLRYVPVNRQWWQYSCPCASLITMPWTRILKYRHSSTLS